MWPSYRHVRGSPTRSYSIVDFVPGFVGIIFRNLGGNFRGVWAKVLLNYDPILINHEGHYTRRAVVGWIRKKGEALRHFSLINVIDRTARCILALPCKNSVVVAVEGNRSCRTSFVALFGGFSD